MIQWWGWIVIWGGLVLALLAMLALFAWWLFRKGLRLLDDVADLADAGAVLEFEDAEMPKQAIAVLADARDIRSREEARKAHRANRRRLRHERRMARARRITSPEAAHREWPADWSR